ncbi:MAG: aminodeoxychorismate lyase [Motiliproteus sp.]
MIMTLVNGQPEAQVSTTDRGFSYGDGVFETIRVSGGKALLLQRHLNRMKDGLFRININYKQHLIDSLLSEVSLLCDGVNEAFIKVVISRGSGGRGYRCSPELQPTRVVMRVDAPRYPATLYKQGAELFACSTRLGSNPQLAGIKHLNRIEQVLARNEWQDQYVEGLVCDQQGYLVEGTMSNLFLIRDDSLVTPLLDCCGVAGVVRSVIIDAAAKHGVTFAEQRLTVDDLLQADGAFMTNSGFGVLPVSGFDGRVIPLSAITATASHWLEETRRCEQ